MKLTTALYTAAFVLAPAVGFAADQSARQQQDSTTASDRSYPYPDWPAIAKTAPQKSTDQQQKNTDQQQKSTDLQQKSTDQQKAAEQSGSSGNESEPSLLEKARRALEALSGACGQLRQACLDEEGQDQSNCQHFRATCGSNWLPRP
jgi:hypothetical protein